MSSLLATVGGTTLSWLPRSFQEWRERHAAAGTAPIVAIAGSRGKTTVVRLLDAVFREAGLRTAIWTDQGVEIGGRRQRGELVPWSRALERFRDGSLDVAVQELDWDTVHAVGLPPAVYPAVAVTNLCVNSTHCLVGEEGARALSSLTRVRDAVRPGGTLILGAEDGAVGALSHPGADMVLVAVNRETPIVRAHLEAGAVAAWAQATDLCVGASDDQRRVGSIDSLPLSLAGALGFQVSNALLAAAVAATCGVGAPQIARALGAFLPLDGRAPGSFNVVPIREARVIVDRPSPSWFLRPVLRAIAHLRPSRMVTIVGDAVAIPDDDLAEVGRLLGRSGGAVLLHSVLRSSPRAELLRRGIAANDVPPVVLHVRSERQAVQRGLDMLRPGDIVFAIADRPAAVLRAVERAARVTGT